MLTSFFSQDWWRKNVRSEIYTIKLRRPEGDKYYSYYEQHRGPGGALPEPRVTRNLGPSGLYEFLGEQVWTAHSTYTLDGKNGVQVHRRMIVKKRNLEYKTGWHLGDWKTCSYCSAVFLLRPSAYR